MRFAFVGNSAAPITNFRGHLISDVVARGHKVFALAPDYDEESKARVRSFGAEPVDFRLSRTGLNPVTDLSDAFALYSLLRDLRLGGVLCFGIKPTIYGSLAARVAKISHRFALITGLGYAFTSSGDFNLKRTLVGVAARLLYRLSLAEVQSVFMQNPDDADDFVRMNIVPRDKVVAVNGTGVDLQEWLPAPPVTQPVTFLLAARMLKDKGILEFVQAARAVKTEHPDVRFILAGAADSNPNAIREELISAWVREGVIEWPGHVDINAWLRQTSVFVLPSYREGVPRSSQEALAMARPIITTDAPGCRETVIEGINGYLVPPQDAKSIAEAMVKFVQAPQMIVTMGIASRNFAERKFNVRDVNARMIEVMGL